MNHERRSVEQLNRSTCDDLTFMVNLDQVRDVDQRECNAERINPERSWVYWVSQCNVSSNSFIEPIFSKDAEGGG